MPIIIRNSCEIQLHFNKAFLRIYRYVVDISTSLLIYEKSWAKINEEIKSQSDMPTHSPILTRKAQQLSLK